MKKNLLLILLFLSIGIGDMLGQEFQYNGVYYTVISESEKTVKTRDGYESYYQLVPGNNVSGDLVLPETVYYGETPYQLVEIGKNAFFETPITSVTIPTSVTSIGEHAFYKCRNLGNVEIPNSVTSIGNDAFFGCSLMTTVVIPTSVTSIGVYAFGATSVSVLEFNAENCMTCGSFDSPAFPSSVTYLKIGSQVKNIPDYTFYGCSSLKSVEIPNSVTEIGNSAFRNCSSLTSVTIGNSVTSIGNSAFEGCSGLTSVEIPNSVNSLGTYAFWNCSSLTSVTISNSVTEIVKSTFSGCSSLTSVEIPNSVISIGERAFYGCSSLTSVEIPNSVIYFEDSAFKDCNLKYIKLENDTPPSFYSAFSSYTSMATLEIPQNSVLVYMVSGWRNFLNILSNGEEIGRFVQNDGVFEYQFLVNEGKAILSGCLNNDMSTASIPDRVVGNHGGEEKFYPVSIIASDAFRDNRELSHLKLPANLEIIGDAAFRGCSGLTNVEIPNSVNEIGNYAFYGCSSLTSVTIGNSVTSLGAYAFCGCSSLTSVTIGNSVTSLGAYAFYGCSSLTSVTIPNSVTSIGNYAFGRCSSLTSVEIPNSVTSIGDYTFYGCSSLTSVEIPNSVISIGRGAFYGCSSLTSVEIPNSVTEIGDYAFEGCSSLTSVEIPNSVTEIGDYAFEGCSRLTSVEIPNSVISIGERAFFGCSSLTSVEIPNSVTEIGDSAFSGCSALTSVEIPNSVTYIGDKAFENIDFDAFRFSDGNTVLKFNNDNNISTKALYLGRNFSGALSLSDLESLEVGGFVENIPSNIFNQSTLKSVTINPGGQLVIEENAFEGCEILTELVLPEDIAEIGANAFSGTGLKNVTVPGGVIGANAFANCNLDNIILGANVESIGEMAFDGSNAIKNVYATPTTPPAAQNNTFSYYEAQLWVPEEAIDTYYNFTRCWYRFNGKPLICPENINVTGPASFNGKPGETLQLSATITPANVTLDRVLWRSTNPAVATVDNNGLVTIHNFQSSDEAMARAVEEGFCQIIATTLYEESPVAVVNIEVKEDTSSIEYVNSEDKNTGASAAYGPNDIYTLQGVCVKRQASQSDIDALTPGLYIIGGKKVVVK